MLFVTLVGAALGAVLAPLSVIVEIFEQPPSVWEPLFDPSKLGYDLITGFILLTSVVIGLTAGVLSSLIGYGLVALSARVPAPAPIRLAVLTFAIAAATSSLLSYGAGADQAYALEGPLVPAAVGAVLLALIWNGARRRTEPLGPREAER